MLMIKTPKLTMPQIEAILADCDLGSAWGGDWYWRVHAKGDGYLVQLVFMGLDAETKQQEYQHCRKWFVSRHAIPAEVVRTAWKAFEAALLHEAEEVFTYKGAAIFNPHIIPETLVNVAGDRVRR